MALKVQNGLSDRSQFDGDGPPAVSTPYTACYCEENVYHLGEALSRILLVPRTKPVSPSTAKTECKIFAVFISNPTKSVAVFEQLRSTRGSDLDFLVVWDYHVILCLELNGEVWVYDADTRLGSPCKWDRYVENTFKCQQLGNIPYQYRCMFRVVPIGDYLANFASDRSHMIRASNGGGEDHVSENSPPQFIAPPPPYPAIVGPSAKQRGEKHNLISDFVVMETKGHGTVIQDSEFLLDTKWIDDYWVEVPQLVLDGL